MEIGLGALIRFANATPQVRPRLAHQIAEQLRSDYNPATDFWRPMRKRLIATARLHAMARLCARPHSRPLSAVDRASKRSVYVGAVSQHAGTAQVMLLRVQRASRSVACKCESIRSSLSGGMTDALSRPTSGSTKKSCVTTPLRLFVTCSLVMVTKHTSSRSSSTCVARSRYLQ